MEFNNLKELAVEVFARKCVFTVIDWAGDTHESFT